MKLTDRGEIKFKSNHANNQQQHGDEQRNEKGGELNKGDVGKR